MDDIFNEVGLLYSRVELHFPNLTRNRLRGKAMISATLRTENLRARSVRSSFAVAAVRLLWLLVRIPLLAVTLALEPAANFVLTAVGVLGIAAALILRLSGALPEFPFWGMLGFSVGALSLLSAYHTLLCILAR